MRVALAIAIAAAAVGCRSTEREDMRLVQEATHEERLENALDRATSATTADEALAAYEEARSILASSLPLCEAECEAARDRCTARCGTDTSCIKRCWSRYVVCVIDCGRLGTGP